MIHDIYKCTDQEPAQNTKKCAKNRDEYKMNKNTKIVNKRCIFIQLYYCTNEAGVCRLDYIDNVTECARFWGVHPQTSAENVAH